MTPFLSQIKKISIVILTCDRKPMLINLLGEIKKQTLYPICEIIIVNNGKDPILQSDHNIPKLSNISIINTGKNIGCAGRNLGIKKAGGDIIVTLDDDVFLRSQKELEKICEFFENFQDASALNFRILFPETFNVIPFNWYHPRSFEKYSDTTFLTDYISEGAVAFKRNALESIELYPEEFFLSHEGIDLAYRIIDSGGNIYYSGIVEVLHKCSLVRRVDWRNTYYDTRNYIWFLVKNFPVSCIFWKICINLPKMFIYSVQRKNTKHFFIAIYDSLKGIRVQIIKRKKIKRVTIKKIEEIKSFQPSFYERVAMFFNKMKARNLKY